MGHLYLANTRKDIIARLKTETRTALDQPEVRERTIAHALEPAGNNSAEFTSHVEGKNRKYAEQVRATGIQPK